MTAFYSLTHFAVDFACGGLMLLAAGGDSRWYIWMLLYNFCAFGLQLPLGIFADGFNRNGWIAAAGCGGIIVGIFAAMGGFTGPAVVLSGVGNAAFHVGGGIDVLNGSLGRAAPLGVFVAPGAMGIFLGMSLGGQGRISLGFLAALLAAAGLLLVWRLRREGIWRQSENEPFSLGKISRRKALAACFCMLAVVLRSYLGMYQNFPWKQELAGSALLIAISVVLGKLAGGILADLRGFRWAAWVSMSAAALLFLFCHFPAAGLMAVLLWNMSMPLTLWRMAELFPGAKGFSFGCLTFGLFLGFFLPYLSRFGGAACCQGILRKLEMGISEPWGMAGAAVLCLCFLLMVPERND